MVKRLYIAALFSMICMLMVSCSNEILDYNNPDVDLFVKQLKDGTYATKNSQGVISVPEFTIDDIPKILDYADDMTVISDFPIGYNAMNGKLRLGECMLWIIESIRLNMPASMGAKMVRANAPNYEGLYFLSDEEVLDAALRYRSWWENRNYPRTIWTIDPCFNEPLCGSGFRWW